MKFIRLFEPMKIKHLEIQNRFVMPAMHLNYSSEGYIDEVESNFYIERAKGGVGLMIVGGIGVDQVGRGPSMVMLDDDKYIPGMKAFAEKIHSYGTKLIAQLYMPGRYAISFVSGLQPVAPSSVYSNFSKETPHELTIPEIKQLQKNAADAAERAKKSNWDGVELLGNTGYLINQFLSPITNKRTDEYGGSFENRLRFPLELIKVVQDRVGKDFIVGMRVSGDDFMPGSLTYKEVAEVVKRYEDMGVDYLHVTGGWHETRIPQLTTQVPVGTYAYLAENVKKSVKHTPVFSANRITDPIVAENIIRDGKADAVSIGRALIADPYFIQKTKEGRLWDIVKCVGCNQGCFDHIFLMKPVECMRNFLVTREGKYDLTKKTQNPKRIVIVGAGPAGLEAARVGTILGHNITLIEKNNEIGGQANVAFVPYGRESIQEIIKYYKNQIEHLKIDVRLNTEATPEYIQSLNPDVVIFATGVKYSIPPIEGIDGSKGSSICFADDALAGDYPVGRNVVVVGGAATGVETAIWAAKMGALTPEQAHFLGFYNALPMEEIVKRWEKGPRSVTIMELLPKIASSIGKSSRWVMVGELKKLGVKVMTNVRIKKFEGKTVIYEESGEIKTLDNIDTFILATGVKPNQDLYKKVKAMNPPFKVLRIGDCKKPRTMLESIHEGFKSVYNLDKSEEEE